MGLNEKSASNLDEVPILPPYFSVLLRRVQTKNLMNNSLVSHILLELRGHIVKGTITMKGTNRLQIDFVFQHNNS